VVDDVGDAHADVFGMLRAFIRIVAGKNRHIAAAAAGLVEKAARRGAGPQRRDDFQENGIDRQQRVLKAIFADIAVAIAHPQPHDRGDVADQRFEVRRHQADLPEPDSASVPLPKFVIHRGPP
jgi:hypothetical protein